MKILTYIEEMMTSRWVIIRGFVGYAYKLPYNIMKKSTRTCLILKSYNYFHVYIL